MGRGKLSMELIGNEKKREKTFQKRKKGLMKKADEFTTLTGVKMGIIIYGGDTNKHPEIWPVDAAKVRVIIDEFKAKKSSAAVKTCLLPDYLLKRCKTYRDATKNLKKAKFLGWYDCFNTFSLNQIQSLITNLDSIHQTALQRKALLLKLNNNQMTIATPTQDHHAYNNYYYIGDDQSCSLFDHQHGTFNVHNNGYHHHLQPWANPYPIDYQPITNTINPIMLMPNTGFNYDRQLPAASTSTAAYIPFSAYQPSPINMASNELMPPLLPAPASYHHHGPSMEPFKQLDDECQQPQSMLSITSHLDYYPPENKRWTFFN